jgi:hypothetical protein
MSPKGELAWQHGEPKPSFGAVNPEVARSRLSEPKLRGTIPRGASPCGGTGNVRRDGYTFFVSGGRSRLLASFVFSLSGSQGVDGSLGAIAERKHASPADGGHALRDGERVCGTLPDLLSRDHGSGTLHGFRPMKMQVDGRRLSLRLVFALTGGAGAAARLSRKALLPFRGFEGERIGWARRPTRACSASDHGTSEEVLAVVKASRGPKDQGLSASSTLKRRRTRGASLRRFRSWRQRKLR